MYQPAAASKLLTSSQALAHSPALSPSQVSRALSIAVSMADLSVACGRINSRVRMLLPNKTCC